MTGILIVLVVCSRSGYAADLSKAWIGISFQDSPRAELDPVYSHSAPEGAVTILQVFKGSSGEQAGLQTGDVILAINGQELNGRKTLLDTVTAKKVGDLVELKIGRKGGILRQQMALSPKPEDMASITRLLIGAKARELEGNYYARDAGTLHANLGKVVLLDFWATWCGPCRYTLPALEALYIKYRGKGLEIIGISSENLAQLQQFQAGTGQSYPLFNDVSQLTIRKYQAFAYPTLMFIDRKGVIQRIETGAHPREQVEKWILELL